ncbi:MAG: hypothetical protein M3R10_00940 [Verrucomicrobiota bacterium]|nr:hypothetical protein [Verrucomicrobiota bacterium]
MFHLNVLNPGGRDPEQHFVEGATLDPPAHAPVNFHAYAACTGGSFLADAKRAVLAKNPVLLLLRGDFKESERALNFLKKAGMTVAISLKETGLHQIADQLRDAGRLSRFKRMLAQADGCIGATPEAADFYRATCSGRIVSEFIPTPYPLHDARWNFAQPNEQRRGIFVGTREFDVPSRNHLAALMAARQISDATGEKVTVYNFDGRKGERLLEEIGLTSDRLIVLKRGTDYASYLRVVAAHKIVFQLDTSFVPGQVAGDALLCRVPCVGGNGAIERLAFPETCGANRSISELIEIAIALLQKTTAEIDDEQAKAKLGFFAVAERLADFFAGL